MGEEIKCRRCGGEGKVPTSYVSWDKCPVCRGTGKLPPEKKEVRQVEGVNISRHVKTLQYNAIRYAQESGDNPDDYRDKLAEDREWFDKIIQILLKSRDEELIGELEKLPATISRDLAIDLIRKREGR